MGNADLISTGQEGNVASTTTSSLSEKNVRFPLILKNQFPDNEDILPQEFEVEKQLEGPQIQIRWSDINKPSAVTEFKLVRRKRRFPLTHEEGEVVYKDSPEGKVVNDLEVEPDVFYYYKLYVLRRKDNRYISNEDLQGYEMTYQSGEWGDKLYNLLPSYFRKKDVENAEDKGLFRPLIEQKEEEEKQDILNHIEDQNKKFPQLFRIIKVFGRQFDQIDGLIDQLSIITNPLKTGPDELRRMSDLFGMDIDQDLTRLDIRDRIRDEIDVDDPDNGNEEGNFDFDSDMVKADDWLLYSNKNDNTSFDVHRPDMMKKETAENEANFSWGRDFTRFHLIVFVYTNSNNPFKEKERNRLQEHLDQMNQMASFDVYIVDRKGKVDRMEDSEINDVKQDQQS